MTLRDDDHPLDEACPCIVCGYARNEAPANDITDEPAPTVAMLRAWRRRSVRDDRPLSREEREAAGLLVLPEDVRRPRTRGDCIDGVRPCPWVSCKWHLYLDVSPTGALKLNQPQRNPWELEETCVLDVAARGGETLERVGRLVGLTRERVRQLEEIATGKLRRRHPGEEDAA